MHWWARLASLLPSVVNFFTRSKLTGPIAKKLAGIDAHRRIPAFAETTFRAWFKQRTKSDNITGKGIKPRVILWPDTFNNFFLPETLVAAVKVLEAAGFQVTLPRKTLCCGRPLYDFGMLKTAKVLLKDILYELKDDIRNEIPIVGLEPSCVAVFRDELAGLFPNDQDAIRLKEQVFTLAEFLEKKAPRFSIPPFNAKALVHVHCHQKSVLGMDCDRSLYKKMALDREDPRTLRHHPGRSADSPP